MKKLKYWLLLLFAKKHITINTMAATSKKSIYDLTLKSLNGQEINFNTYKGKKLLIVNTASECGYTPQYEELQYLHEHHGDKITVLGFPANNFGGQEPGSNEEIATFCRKTYDVTFPVMSKVSVKGDDTVELFKWLTEQQNPDFTGDINWNFEKFLIDENGKLIHRFRSKVKPDSPELLKAIEGK